MFTPLKNFTADNSLHVEASLALVSTLFESTERLTALNLNVSRSLLQHSAASIKAVQGSKDVKSLVSLQAANAGPVIDAAMAYSRDVYEIASKAKEEAARIVDVQVADVNAEVSERVDSALQRAPAGSEMAVAVVRSAINAGNSAYDRLNVTASHLIEIAEANMSAASQATFKAAANAAKVSRKAA